MNRRYATLSKYSWFDKTLNESTVQATYLGLAIRVRPDISKEDYLTWVKEWKRNYKILASEIRKVKEFCSSAGQVKGLAGARSNAQTETARLRDVANDLLNLRRCFKIVVGHSTRH